MNKRLLVVSLLSIVFAPALNAMELRTPLELESAATLPQWIGSPRWKSAMMSVGQRFGQNGGKVPLGYRLNKTIAWSEVIAAQPTEDSKAQARALIAHLGFSETDSPGQTSGDVGVSANVQIPVFAYGITDRWTVAVALPIVNASIAADSGLLRSAQGQAFVAAAESASGPLKALEATQKLNDAVNQKLIRMGYEPVRSFDVAGIGDVRIVQKYAVHRTSEEALALKFDIVAPTGKPPNPDRVIDLPLGDGQVDVGAGLVYEKNWFGNFYSAVSANYLWQLPHRTTRRVPTSANDILSEDREQLTRKIGDQWSMQASARYGLPQYGMTLGVGYAYQKQFRTNYTGGALAPERYRWLADLTSFDAEMDVHSVVAQLGFSTVDFYRTQKFPLPLQISVVYSRPFAGSNATTNDLVAGEFTAFF